VYNALISVEETENLVEKWGARYNRYKYFNVKKIWRSNFSITHYLGYARYTQQVKVLRDVPRMFLEYFNTRGKFSRIKVDTHQIYDTFKACIYILTSYNCSSLTIFYMIK
jgi:hypothetical protein